MQDIVQNLKREKFDGDASPQTTVCLVGTLLTVLF